MAAERAGTDVVAWCRATCLALPGASLDHPFSPDSDVLRVHRKMFALLMHVPQVSAHPIVNLKAEPQEIPLLVAAHQNVLRGWHMNKRHWISVELAPRTDRALLEELIEDSYDNVVAGLPARLRSSLASLRAGTARSALVDDGGSPPRP